MKDQFAKYFSLRSIVKYVGFTILFIAISFFSIYALLKQFNNISFSEIHIFSTTAVIQMVLLMFGYVAIDSFRTYFILRVLGEKIRKSYILILAFINFFICNITPFSIGGAFAMIYFLHKKGLPVGKAAAVTSLKALLASAFNMMIFPFSLLYVLGANDNISNMATAKRALTIFPFVLIGYVIILILLFKLLKHREKINLIIHRFYSWIYHRKWISSHTFYKLYESTSTQINTFSYNVRTFFSGAPKYIVLSFVATILYYIAIYLFSVIMVNDLSLNLSALQTMAFQSVATLIMYFGATPGASGIAEGGYAYLFSKLVTEDIQLAALTFYWRLFTTYITSGIGGILFFGEVYRVRKQNRLSKKN